MNWQEFIALFSLDGKAWILDVFSIIFITALVHYIGVRIYKRLVKKFEKTKSIWDEALATAAYRPFEGIIWLVGVTYAFQAMSQYVEGFKILAIAPTVRQAGIVILMALFLLRLTNQIEKTYIKSPRAKEGAIDITTAQAIGHILRVSIFVTSILVILPIFNIPISGLLTIGGAGTVIVGFAAKDLLANFFGAIMIFMDRPFSVGDWIESPDKDFQGTVEHIGWRLTRIRRFDKRPIYVPNSIFANVSVINPSRMSNRRIKEIVGIRYQDADKLGVITKDIKDMLLNHSDIDTSPGKACYVNMVAFGPSSLDIEIYTFTKTTAWIPYQAIKQDVLLKILAIITKHGAQVAFPTRTVEVPGGLELLEVASQKG